MLGMVSMDWSASALKVALGVGSLSAMVFLVEPFKPYIGLWMTILIALVPFSIFVFFRVGEVSERLVKTVHLLAIGWYLVLSLFALCFSLFASFELSFVVLYFFILSGFVPCVWLLYKMKEGAYDDEQF